MLERNEIIIKQKMKQYLLPGIMLTAALQIGNIVDSMLVGSILGPEAMSAVKIGMAVDNIVEIPGYVLGVGGSIVAGMYMGNRECEKARRVFSSTLFISIVMGFLFSLASIGSPMYANFLCGGSNLVNDATDFIRVTLLLAPILNIALQVINYVAVDNNPNIASAYVITANILNLTLDYVLLKYTSLGTAGAALSTNLGYGLALLVLILYVKSKKRMLGFENPFKEMRFSLLASIKAGIPTLLFMVLLTLKDITLNTMIVTMVGSSAIIIYTVCANSALCVQLFAGGVVGLLSSMGSVLYGSRDYFGIRILIKYVIKISYAMLAVFMIIMLAFPQIFLSFFGITEEVLVAEAIVALRIYTLSLPVYLLNHFMVVYYQSTDKVVLSSIVTSFQTCLAVVPVAFLFVKLAALAEADKLFALILAFVASEIITLIVTLLYQKIKYKKENFLMIPKGNDSARELSVCKNEGEITQTVKEIFTFCEESGISRNTANRMAVAVEEMIGNIFKYGGKNAGNVDVIMYVEDKSLNLRLTDDGIPFNPLEYKEDETEFEIHGISVVKDISSHVEYLRVLDLNNTMICVEDQ